MKQPILILLVALALTNAYGQSPKSFKYQAVLRDQSGVLLSNKNVTIQISILKGSASGISTYSEKQAATTSMTGIINLEIGKGTLLSGSFTGIEWGKDSHFIKVEMDPKGGSAFELVGVAQLLSVPYSLYAEKSGDEKWEVNTSKSIYYNAGRVGINTSLPSTKLEINGGGDLDLLGLKNENNSSGLTNTVSSNIDFHASAFIGKRSRGTLLGPATVSSGDRITGIYGSLFANGAYQNSAAIQMYVGANPGVSSFPSTIRFETTGTGQIDRLERMRITEAGNVGIGTTTPAYKLDVAGTINATQLLVNGSPALSAQNQVWKTSSSTIYYNSGKVGIGTTTPVSNLDIAGINSTIGLHKIQFKSTESENKGRLEIKSDPSDLGNIYSTSLDRTGDSSEDLIFGLQQPLNNTSSWNIFESWRGAGLMISASSPDLAPLTFGIDRVEKARLATNGNFGIGTATPKAKLQVQDGDVYINSISSGVIMKSPNGQCWRMTVSNTGTPVFSSITCP